MCSLFNVHVLNNWFTVNLFHSDIEITDTESLLAAFSSSSLSPKSSSMVEQEGRKEMFYLTMHSTHFIYGYMASDIWLRTILIVREETHCCHIGYSFQLAARVLLYAPSHRQDSTYNSLCYTSCKALAGTRNSSMGPPWANALTTELATSRSPW